MVFNRHGFEEGLSSFFDKLFPSVHVLHKAASALLSSPARFAWIKEVMDNVTTEDQSVDLLFEAISRDHRQWKHVML